MTELVSVGIVAFFYSLGCYLLYAEGMKDKWWFIPATIFLGMCTSATWAITAKIVQDKDRIFVVSLLWDSVMVAIYYGLPILLFGVRLDRQSMIGGLLIILGVLVLKVRLTPTP